MGNKKQRKAAQKAKQQQQQQQPPPQDAKAEQADDKTKQAHAKALLTRDVMEYLMLKDARAVYEHALSSCADGSASSSSKSPVQQALEAALNAYKIELFRWELVRKLMVPAFGLDDRKSREQLEALEAENDDNIAKYLRSGVVVRDDPLWKAMNIGRGAPLCERL